MLVDLKQAQLLSKVSSHLRYLHTKPQQRRTAAYQKIHTIKCLELRESVYQSSDIKLLLVKIRRTFALSNKKVGDLLKTNSLPDEVNFIFAYFTINEYGRESQFSKQDWDKQRLKVLKVP